MLDKILNMQIHYWHSQTEKDNIILLIKYFNSKINKKKDVIEVKYKNWNN